LFWALQTLNLDEGSQEAAVPGLNREAVYEQRIIVPTKEAQSLIADFLNREVARIDNVLEIVGAQSVTGVKDGSLMALLLERRTALITAAITGQISEEEMRA
jgi:type I restriction enzyme S subunit